MQHYNKNPGLYRSMFYGDWITKRPRMHILMIRIGGVLFILMACFVFLVSAFSERLAPNG